MGTRKKFASFMVLAVLLAVFVVEFLFPRTAIPNASAVETTQDVGVYWDRSCSLAVYSIDWGVLSPGELKEVVVYVRNEGVTPFLLIIKPTNLNPGNVFEYLRVSWACESKLIEVGEVVQVTHRLLVYPYTRGISSFSFGIVFEEGTSILGDLNLDGVVDGRDLTLFIACYKGLTSPETMYLADLGGGTSPQFFVCDGVVDDSDLTLFLLCYRGLGP